MVGGFGAQDSGRDGLMSQGQTGTTKKPHVKYILHVLTAKIVRHAQQHMGSKGPNGLAREWLSLDRSRKVQVQLANPWIQRCKPR